MFNVILLYTLHFAHYTIFAQPPVGEIQRAEEILEKEKILREKLEKKEKIFIKKIIIEGASLISEEKLEEIILPFPRKWLSKEDIQQILEQILQAYKQKDKEPEISYQIRKRQLKILIKE